VYLHSAFIYHLNDPMQQQQQQQMASLFMYLIGGVELDHQRGLLVPDENETILGLDHQVDPNAVDLIRYFCFMALFYNFNLFIRQQDLSVLQKQQQQQQQPE
jgi:hypothetical protein